MSKWRITFHKKLCFVFFLGALVTSCDWEGKKNCQWTLEPEPKLIGTTTEPGMIPVCARNRTTNKEDCRFQTKMDFAKSAWGKKFRYVDMTVNAKKLPRIVNDITYCSEK